MNKMGRWEAPYELLLKSYEDGMAYYGHAPYRAFPRIMREISRSVFLLDQERIGSVCDMLCANAYFLR